MTAVARVRDMFLRTPRAFPARPSLLSAAVWLASGSVLGGCTEPPAPRMPAVARVEVSAERTWFLSGDSLQLVATAFDAAGRVIEEPGNLVWTSENDLNIQVSSAGVARRGPAFIESIDAEDFSRITATVGDVSGSVVVQVLVPIVDFTFEPELAELQLGESFTLRVLPVDRLGRRMTPSGLVLTSRDTALVRVSATGVLSANVDRFGSTYVVASALGHVDSTVVRVVTPHYVWPDTSVLFAGMSRRLELHTFTRQESIRTVSGGTWSSSNEVVATVDSAGVVVARTPGVARIDATLAGKTASAEILVDSVPQLRFKQMSLSYSSACGLTTDGDVYCWGDDRLGGLGTAARTDRCEEAKGTPKSTSYVPPYTRYTWRCSAIPRRVESSEPFAELAGTCARTVAGRVLCWAPRYGKYEGGLPGDIGGPEFRQISRGCGVATDGRGYCWGDDLNGALGNGPGRVGAPSPEPVASSTTWLAIAATGDQGACALDATGVPWCWGLAPVTGSLAESPPGCYVRCSESPVPVTFDPRYASTRFDGIATARMLGCALPVGGGAVYCWGGNQFSDVRAVSVRPAVDQPSQPLTRIERGPVHDDSICGVNTAGEVYCVKYRQGGPADSAFVLRREPIGVPLRSIAFLDSRGCGVGLDGIVYCWGYSPLLLGAGRFTGGGVASTNPIRVAGQ